jgi:hypothetical protein
MSNVFMIRKGGGGTVSGAFAVLSVSFPAGSTCTLSKGSKIYRAQNNTNTVLFAIPEAGDWIITIQDGGKQKTTTVPITEQGQVERIVIGYSTVLFEPGSGSEALWETSGTGSASSQNITVIGGVTNGTVTSGWAYLKEAISMAGLSLLTVVTTKTKGISDDGFGPAELYLIEEPYGPTAAEHASITQQIPDGENSGANAWKIDIKGLDPAKRYFLSLYASGNRREGEPGQWFVYESFVTVTGAVLT